MDSVTQAVFGAGIAALVAPHDQRRKAALMGAALGTLPDLDVLIDYGGAVENFTYHRGFSHSFLVLLPVSVLLWLALARLWQPARAAPLRWLAVVALPLVTHPLLDAHTAYGTQLFWPMTVTPTMWATLFIIDPLYTLPLIVGAVLIIARPHAAWSYPILRAAFTFSVVYMAWSWGAQGIAKNTARDALAAAGIRDAKLFVTPTPFNTLLWRVVVRSEQGVFEGFDSLLVDEETMRLQPIASDAAVLTETADIWAVRRLRWFSDDFLKVEIDDERLILRDLRMGQEPSYVFSHVVAERRDGRWQPVATELLPVSFEDRALGATWQRIWSDSID